MDFEPDDILDDILCRWHRWASAAKIVRGFAPRALVVGEFRISRQYDDQNGALDDDLENRLMRSVEFCVSGMVNPWQAAVHVNARALALGYEVFNSPRLPADRQARMMVISEARGILRRRLTDAGVL